MRGRCGVGPGADGAGLGFESLEGLAGCGEGVVGGGGVDQLGVGVDGREVGPVWAGEIRLTEPLLLGRELLPEGEDPVELLEFGDVPLQPLVEGVLGRDGDGGRPGAVEGVDGALGLGVGREGFESLESGGGAEPLTRTCVEQGPCAP